MVLIGMLAGCLLTAEQLGGTGEDGGDTGDGSSTTGDGGGTMSGLLDMVKVPVGTFTMGCTEGQGGECFTDEEPAHEVQLTRSFYLSRTEITQAQWEVVTGDNPSNFGGCPYCPVEMVSWFDAVSFANDLSSDEGLEPCYEIDGENVSWHDGLDCEGYRLPTEAEWEYAARAGQDTMFAGADALEDVGWYSGNSDLETHPVGSKEPNAWGLYDMSGNVWEYTWDWWDNYSSTAQVDPTGPSAGQDRVFRGGSWANPATGSRLAIRGFHPPDYGGSGQGLRLARSIP